MSYREEERSRLRRQSTKQAIALAMQGSWKEAVSVNQSILEVFPHDVEALNRLGRAHLEQGDYDRAEEAYRRTTEIDPHNAIALKNLQRLSRLREAAGGVEGGADKVDPQSFIAEVGKAGVVRLVDLAAPGTVARMAAGDRVQLKSDGTGLIVEGVRGEYLGRVEPGHGQRLVRLMEGGNRYSAAIVSSAEDAVRVIVREVYRDPSQAGRVSFPYRRVGSGRFGIGDRVIRRELEQDASSGDSGYTVVGGAEGTEVLVEESVGSDYDTSEEE